MMQKWLMDTKYLITILMSFLPSNNKVVSHLAKILGTYGDVNQGFSGLQEKYGEGRIFDTGIRELSIVGQAIGMALRGLKPIAEIQYLDYLLYGLQPLSDDVCTTHFRTMGQQSVPLIIRTRGHRLEGIWHSGSPMGMIINCTSGHVRMRAKKHGSGCRNV